MRKILCSVCLVCLLFSCKKQETTPEPPNAINNAPIANAGNDAVINIPEISYTLDGRESYDPDKTFIDYSWRQISGPELYFFQQNENQTTATLTVKKEGVYEFELEVKDRQGLSDRDTMMLTVNDDFAIGKTPVISLYCDSFMLPSSHVSFFELTVNAFVMNDLSEKFNITSGFSVRQIQGPLGAVIQEAYYDSGRTVIPISSLRRGTYQFQVEVVRKGIIAYDTATVVVVEDTLQGKEFIFETRWERYADKIVSAKTPENQVLFYLVPFRKAEVFVLFEDDPDWYKADYGWNSANDLIYITNSCNSSIEVFQVFDYGIYGVGDRVKIKVKYL